MAKQKTYKTLAGAQKAAGKGFTAIELTAGNAAELGYPEQLIGQFVVISGTVAADGEVTPEPEVQVGDVVLRDRVLREVEPGSWERVGGDGTRFTDDEVEQMIADADAEPEEQVIPNTLEANRQQSTIEKPVAMVHAHVAARLSAEPGVARKTLMKELQDMGIAFYTARTQIQIALKKLRGQRAAVQLTETPPADTPEVVEQTA